VSEQPPGFSCPKCGRTSHHPDDIREGYCGACHDWTGTPAGGATATIPLSGTDPANLTIALGDGSGG
jgi:hypothetical protein